MPPVRRAYSLASWSADFARYELAIKHEKNGKVSTWILQNLIPGTSLEALPPAGRFYLPAPPSENERLILVVGGIGITPLRAMLNYLKNCGSLKKDSVWLFYAARIHDQLLWHEEFESLSNDSQWFRYVPILSKPSGNWSGKIGRLTASDLLIPAENLLDTHYYFCASLSMITMLRTELECSGVPADRLHYESFGMNTPIPENPPAKIDIVGFGTAYYEGHPNLLAALESAGYSLEASCRIGECGGCAMKLITGNVTMLTQPQCKLPSNHILACCCAPASDLVLACAN